MKPERFSASVAARHMACHASANLPLAIPNWQPPVEDPTADNAANRGTAKHKMTEPILELPAKEIRMMANLFSYVAEVRSRRRFKVLIEQPVKAEWLPKPTDTKADLVLYTQDEIHVIDQKWGKIPVEVKENQQLLFYAASYGSLAPKAKGVTGHILQPYCDTYEEWFIDASRLKQFMDDAIAAQRAIQAGSVAFGPGDHCTFCPAFPHGRGQKGAPLCPATMQMLYPTYVNEDEILNL